MAEQIIPHPTGDVRCSYLGCTEKEDNGGLVVLQKQPDGTYRIDWYCSLIHASLALMEDAQLKLSSLGFDGTVLDLATRSLSGERILFSAPTPDLWN